jgi:uncharacterized protein (UPF0335 family)
MIDTASNEQLRLHVEAIEALVEEKKGIADDIKDRFAVAKSDGFDTKALAAVLRRRATERAALEEHDALVELYESHLA